MLMIENSSGGSILIFCLHCVFSIIKVLYSLLFKVIIVFLWQMAKPAEKALLSINLLCSITIHIGPDLLMICMYKMCNLDDTHKKIAQTHLLRVHTEECVYHMRKKVHTVSFAPLPL